jgi:hypothetical protein
VLGHGVARVIVARQFASSYCLSALNEMRIARDDCAGR